MKIAIASGKGGTGKTTVAVNLAVTLKGNVNLIDCDVEEPNCHLFLDGKIINQESVYIKVPEINNETCSSCGKCSDFCEFKAIASLTNKTIIFPELCHSCGGCSKICPNNAIIETNKVIGTISRTKIDKINLTSGFLNIGTAIAPPLIKAVKADIKDDIFTIIDAPPGTSCPVISTVDDVDFVVLVTEPTPFGLNDLKLAVEMLQALKKPFGIVINRMISGHNITHEFCQKNKLEILAEIPNDINIAKTYSNGGIIAKEMPEYKKTFTNLMQKIKEKLLCKN